MIEYEPMWIVESGATNHITKDREANVEFRQNPLKTKWIYVGSNLKVKVRGMDTFKLKFRGGCTLILHDILFAPNM